MSFDELLDKKVQLQRPTSSVLDAVTVAATMTKSRDPASTALLRATLAGAQNGTGTVAVTGTLSGAVVSENLTFTKNGFVQGAQQFDAITLLTTSGLANESPLGTLSIEAVTPDGQPIVGYPIEKANVAARIEQASGREAMAAQGRSAEATHFIIIRYDGHVNYTPPADKIVDGAISYEVIRANAVHGHREQHHWEILAKLL